MTRPILTLLQVNEECVAQLNLADCQFSFESHSELDQPAWMAPEGTSSRARTLSIIRSYSVLENGLLTNASDIWSFAVLLWELYTRRVPFADLTSMQCGLKVANEFVSEVHRTILRCVDRSRASPSDAHWCVDLHRQSHSALHARRAEQATDVRCDRSHSREDSFLVSTLTVCMHFTHW